MPATFWVTSPLNILTENSAAGSEGMGIWYIFAAKVIVSSLSFSLFSNLFLVYFGEIKKMRLKTIF